MDISGHVMIAVTMSATKGTEEIRLHIKKERIKWNTKKADRIRYCHKVDLEMEDEMDKKGRTISNWERY